jgi:hypothetical protein
MPKFYRGAPQVTFIKRNGNTFTNTYHSRNASAKSVKSWRSKGGKVKKTGYYDKTSSWTSKSGITSRSSMTNRDTKIWKQSW